MFRLILLIFSCLVISTCTKPDSPLLNLASSRLSERIGNFSIELLYQTTHAQEKRTNFIISPITVWSVLAVIAEGASDNTLKEISKAIRLPYNFKDVIKEQFRSIEKFLVVNTSTIELQKINALFIDINKRPLKDFVQTARDYETRIIPANFTDPKLTSDLINTAISNVTRGHISEIVSANDLSDASLLLTSALYFKGQWAVPFNASVTIKEPFYDSDGNKLGEVNMMYNRFTYPLAVIKSLEAKVIELPYGSQGRLSMLIMVPNPGVSLENMFLNFVKTSLDTVFFELKKAQEEYAEDEVDCFIPRFKIETSLSVKEALNTMGIHDLFNEGVARLEGISNIPIYVSKIKQKAQIEVTEEGTVAAAVTASEFSNRIGVMRFEANRPFSFLIVEKITNTIAFGGFYRQPSLY